MLKHIFHCQLGILISNYNNMHTFYSHVARMKIKMTNKLLGWAIKPLDVSVVTDQIGPTVVCLKFQSLFGTGLWFETVVPEGPMFTRMVNYVFADWWVPTFIATAMLKVKP